MLDGGGASGKADGGIHGERGGGGWQREGHISGDEHVIGLHRSPDEERRERDDREAETANEISVPKCLKSIHMHQPLFRSFQRACDCLRRSSSL